MANYYANLYNQFIDHAGEIAGRLSGTYLDGLEGRVLDCGQDRIEIGLMSFVRILQYRRTENVQNDLDIIRRAMGANVAYCAGCGAALGYFIVSRDGEYAVYMGIEDMPANKLEDNLSAVVPDVSFRQGFLPAAELGRLARYGGIVSGDMECRHPYADGLLSALRGVNGVIALLAVPMDDDEIAAYTDSLQQIRQTAEYLTQNDLTYASQTRRTTKRTFPFVPEIADTARKMAEYYGTGRESFWKSCIWFGCERQESLAPVGNAVAGALSAAAAEGGRARVFYTTDNPLRSGRLSLPAALYGEVTYAEAEALLKPSLVSYVSSAHLAGMMQLPSNTVNGFDVIELAKGENSLRLFDIHAGKGRGNAIRIGAVAETGETCSVSLRDVTEHVLVTGATGTGKTNTVKTLVKGIHDAGVPVLIVEPSKKDYWHMAGELRDMRIFSFGQDAELPGINPLAPEDGVIIGNHIDSLLYAFSGAFEMEEPTRLALDGLLKYTYRRFGWDAGDIAYHTGNDFPRIADLLESLPEYCRTHLPYGDEVRDNIYGSLVNRLSSLNSGVIGRAMNARRCVTGRELCETSVLIELEDLSLETKPFVAMLILIKVDQYLRQGDTAADLKNAIVLEEAHNVFAATAPGAGRSPKARASRYFSNMLSQIRGYGTGIIIADQGPSQIHDMAVSNTKIKIIHGITSGEDVDKVAFALNLTDAQKRVFPTLPTGQAAVSIRGSRWVSRVAIDAFAQRPVENIACMLCPQRGYCDRFDTVKAASVPRAALYAQQVCRNPYDPAAVARELNAVADHLGWPTEQRLCLLGALLSDRGIRRGQREKRRIIARYMEYTEG